MKLDELRRLITPIPTELPPFTRELRAVVLSANDSDTMRLPRLEDLERKQAAVLMLFFEDSEGQARVVLTERAAGGHRHAGQVSLPGGAVDDEDASVEAAALREAAEEVGLDPVQAGVEIHGVLPVVDVPVSGFMVHPVIAFAEREPTLVADNYEVASVFTAPVAAFLPGSAIETVTAERDGYRLRYGGYRIDSHHVWGATAMMLSRLGAYIGAATEVDDG
jgi:8-oxo-dGTP pyrophosphatase MutT (NUDIX family)